MNNKYIHKLFSVFLAVLFVMTDTSFVLAFKGETHRKITDEALDKLSEDGASPYYFNRMLVNILNDGLAEDYLINREVSNGSLTKTVNNWISDAAADFYNDAGDDHYYSPTNGKGLNDEGGALLATEAYYSLLNNDFYNCFSLPTKEARDAAFTEALQKAGKMVHLLQDMAVPSYIQSLSTAGEQYDMFEKHVADTDIYIPGYDFVGLDVFDSIDMFFGNKTLEGDFSIGLASYTQNSFLAEKMNDDGPDYKHLESRYNNEGSLTLIQKPVYRVSDNVLVDAGLTYGGWRRYDSYRPVSDPADDYSPYMGLRGFRESYYTDREIFTVDTKVISNQAEYLVQRAYGYSGGFLNFMFRGLVEGCYVTPMIDENGTQETKDDEIIGCVVRIKNLSSSLLSKGSISLFADDALGNRRLLYKTKKTVSADADSMLKTGGTELEIDIAYDRDNNVPAKPLLKRLYKNERIRGVIVFEGEIGGSEGIAYGNVDMYNVMPVYYATRQRDLRSPVDGASDVGLYKYTSDPNITEDITALIEGKDKEIYLYEGGLIKYNVISDLRDGIAEFMTRYFDTVGRGTWFKTGKLFQDAFGADNYSRDITTISQTGILLNDFTEIEKCLAKMDNASQPFYDLTWVYGTTYPEGNRLIRTSELQTGFSDWATAKERAYNDAVNDMPEYLADQPERLYQMGGSPEPNAPHTYDVEFTEQATYYKIYTKGLDNGKGSLYDLENDKITIYQNVQGEYLPSNPISLNVPHNMYWGTTPRSNTSKVWHYEGVEVLTTVVDHAVTKTIQGQDEFVFYPYPAQIISDLSVNNKWKTMINIDGWTYGSFEPKEENGLFAFDIPAAQSFKWCGTNVGGDAYMVYAPLFDTYQVPDYHEHAICIKGIVVDASSQMGNVPIKDAVVSISDMQDNVISGSGAGVTDASGWFMYPVNLRGYVTLKASKEGYTDVYKTVYVKKGDTSVFAGDFELLPLNTASLIGTAGDTVHSDDKTMHVVIPPGALTEDTSIAVTPITNVTQMPMVLPDGVSAVYGLKITPADISFLPTKDITLNITDLHLGDGLKPYIMHYDYNDGKWAVVGQGEKIAGDTITASLDRTGTFVVCFLNNTSGGISLIMTPLNKSIIQEFISYNKTCSSTKAKGSLIDIARGALYMPHAITGVSNIYGERELNFWYSSKTASPTAVIGMDALFNTTATNAEITFSVAGNSVKKYFTPNAETASLKYIFEPVSGDGDFLPSGVYPYTIESTNSYYLNYYTKDAQGDLVDTGITSIQPNDFITTTGGYFGVVNQTASAFGAGWSLDELYRLHPENTSGQVFIETENAGYMVFEKAKGAGVLSKSSTGADTNGNSTFSRSSSDALFTVFASDATDIVPDDTNGKRDIFLYNSYTGMTTRINTASDGTQANDTSDKPHISADGRFVVYQSLATNIVSGDTNNVQDIFIYDALNKNTIRIGGNAASEIGDGYNVVSYDGRYIVFVSNATDFDDTDLNGKADIFQYDSQTGVIARISVFNESGTRSYDCKEAAINHFGAYITYIYPADKNSPASELPFGGVWRFSRADLSLSRVDVGNDEAVSGVSADISGELITFVTDKQMCPGDIDTYKDVYLKNMTDGNLSLVSANDVYTDCVESVISPYGNFVAFTAVNLGVNKVYTKDIVKNKETLSADANQNCTSLSFAGGERYVTYATSATNLDTGKTSSFSDIFIQSKGFYTEYDTPAGSTTVLSVDGQTGAYTLTFKDQNKIEFDADGYQTKREDANGNQILYAHTDTNADGVKELTAITDPGNLVYTFAYIDGKLASITDPANRVTKFTVDEDNNLTSVTDANGSVFSYGYDHCNILTSKTDNNGNSTKYIFDEFNMLKQRIEDVRDVALTDSNGNLNAVPKNVVWEYFPECTVGAVNYLTNGDSANTPATLTLFKDVFGYYTADGKLANYKTRHNAFKKPVLYKDALGRETVLAYDSDNRLLEEVLPNLGTTTYGYDFYDNVTEVTQEDIMAVTRLVYDTAINKVTKVTDAENRETNFGYNTSGDLTSITDADSNMASIARNSDGTASSETDRRSNTTTFGYDTKGRITTITYPTDGGVTPVKTFTYDTAGNLRTVTDEESHTVTYDYDDIGNLTKITTDMGFVTSFVYDGNSNIIKITDELLRETHLTYNSINLLIETLYPDGTSEKRYYDALKRLVRMENVSSDGNIVQKNTFVYNDANELVKNINDSSDVTSYTYTLNSQVETVTDPQGNVTTYAYDKAGRKVSETKADGSVINYTYDKTGLLNALHDEDNNLTSYAYTNLSQVDTVTYPDASYVDYNYDNNGNVLQVRTRGNDVISYTYDKQNRTNTMTLPNSDVHTYTYDKTGLLKTAVRGTNTLRYTYDNDSRLTAEGLTGELVSYTLDNTGNVTDIILPDTTVTTYGYNNVNAINSITQGANSYTLSYDTMGRLLSLGLPNATTTSYTYDNLNRVLSIINSVNAGGVERSKAVYTYNSINQRISKETFSGTTAYAYDALGRLTDITLPDSNDVTYLYNKTDGRVQKKDENDVLTTYKSNNLNRYIKAGMKDIAYDTNGNVSNDGVNTYIYDALNRLVQGVTADKTVNYIYDPSGKLYSREVINNIDQSQISYKRFIYSGDNVIMTKDASGNVIEKYILGGGVDNQLAVAIGSDRYYFNRDGLGSVVSITDSTGAVVESYEYTTFGTPTIKNASGTVISTSAIGNTFMFTGRMWDDVLQLYDYRARVYNPKLGVFYQTDPLGYADSTNMYAYCVNDPVNFVDPYGEIRYWDATKAAVGVVGNTFGLVLGFGLAGVPDVTVSKVAAVVVVTKTSYGIGANFHNLKDAILDDAPSSTGSLFNDVAQEVFPKNNTAQNLASILDLSVDLASGMIARHAVKKCLGAMNKFAMERVFYRNPADISAAADVLQVSDLFLKFHNIVEQILDSTSEGDC